MSFTRLKNPRLRGELMPQSTGTDWQPYSNGSLEACSPSLRMRQSKKPHDACWLTAATKLLSG